MKPGTYSLKLVGILILTASSLAVGLIAANWPRPAVASAQQPISGNALQQIQALLDEKASRSAAQRKIDSQLIYAARIRRGQNIAIGVPTLEINVAVDAQGRIIVDITALPGATLLEDLAKRGAKVISAFPQYRSYRAELALDQLEAVAALPEVRFIQPKQEAVYSRGPGAQSSPPLAAWHELLAPNFGLRAGRVRAALSEFLFGAQQPWPLSPAIGSVTSQGDTTHRAGTARTTFGVNGAGVRIGVISNGVNNLAISQATGDLPASVTILTGQAGSGDEGTAMLEIIYDLAPGAQLFFATANNSLASFAQNIRDLHAAGCQIIVDDVGYFVETPLQDGQTPGVVATTNGGLIAQAVNDVTAAGVLYFSSAGNSGNKNDNTSGVWEGDFVDGGANALLPGGTVHNFGGGVLFDTITGSTSNPGTLFWSDPLGASANDYDLFVLNSTGTSVVTSSTNPQTGTQDPFEIVGGITANNRLVILKKTGAANRFLHLNTNRGRLSLSTAGQTHGHSCSANAYGVAATPAATAIGSPPNPTGPFPNPFNSANTVELFSSDGPRRILYNADSTAITPGNVSATGGLLRQKPDITAADGVAVTGVGGFGSPFFGTSAAAPHAAAIAALLKSAKPAFTPAQIRTALTSTAIDIETAGVDRDAGAGIIMAFEALQSIGAAASPTLTGAGSSLATESCSAANSAIDPGETVTVNLSLKNEGNASTGNLTATLQATGGVTLPGGAQNYGVVVAGGATVTRPFTFTADAALACGGLLTATLQLQDGALNLGTASFTFRLGAIASTPTATYSYGGSPVALPDLNAMEIPITVPDTGVVSDVNVRVRLNHTWDADLSILLISPDGTLVDLSTGNGGSGDNYGSGANNCTGTFTVFDDAAATSIISGSAPFTATFRPAGRLTGFNGKAVNGVWKLRILDVASGDTGTLGCWQIEITRQTFTCCSGGAACPTVSNLNPASGVAGSSVTITGTNFSGVTAVKFSNNVTATITNNTGTQLTVTVPAGAVTGPLTISKTGCADVTTASFTVCSTLTVNPTTLPDGTGGTAYSQTITASGGTAPYSFAVTAGTLPGGLTLASGGLLSGTPNVAGTFNFNVTATAANGCTGTRSYTVNIVVMLGAQTRALYVLNNSTTGNQIYGYAVNETTGALTLLAGFPVATGGNGVSSWTPQQLAIDRANSRLFAINRGSNTVSAYTISATTGALTPLPFSPINLGGLIPNNIAVHPSGSPLVVGLQSNQLTSYQITAATATAAAGSPYSTGNAGPYSAAFSQDGNYIYTGGNSGETFAGFSVNSTTGALSALAGSPFNAGGGPSDSPEAFATDATGRIFLANFFSTQVRVFTTANGIPSAVAGNPFAGGLARAVIGLLHPNGFYMVADYLGNRVGAYQINGNGSATTLAAIGGSPFATGGSLTNLLALNQAGTWLFAANGDTRNLTTFGVNGVTGALASSGTQPADTLGTSGTLAGMGYLPLPCVTVSLTPATLPNGTAGTTYNQTVTASPAGTYNYSVTSGSLPAGLSLNSATGAITGTPATAGASNFTITALSFGPCSGSQTYSITITPPVNTPPSVTPVAVARQAGSPVSNSTIATVSDAETAAGALAVNVNGSASATINNVTVSNLANTNGTISANVLAACNATLGVTNFTINVSDGSLTTPGTLAVTVNANSQPSLTYSNQSVAAGGSLNVTPTTASDNGSITGYLVASVTPALTTAPTVSGSSVVSITNASPGGVHTITIRATDNCGATTDAAFTLTVNCPTISLNPPTLPNGTVGTSYNQTITASGGSPAYSFTLMSGALPTGLSLATGGVLSGAPGASGIFNFTIKATDANGCTGTQTYSITINTPPVINAVAASRQQGSPSSNSTIATVSDADQAANTLTVTVNGGSSTTVNGVTVSGISINAAGAVTANIIASCTATNSSFTLTVTDSATASTSVALNVTVTANSAPALSYSNQSVAAGGSLNVTPTTASDNGSITGYAVISVTPALTTAPTVNASGVVAITNANPAGIHTITIRATDNCGATTDAAFTVNVGCPTITLSPVTLSGGTAGSAYSQMITASGGAAAYTFTISAGALPSGLSLSPGGALSGTPTAAGTFNFTVTATDANGCTGARAYMLVINCPPFTINPTTQSFAASGGTGSVTVTGAAGCAWTAVNNDAWISITSGSSGSGAGTVNYSVAANTGAARSGTMAIAGQTFTATQSAAGAVAGNLDPTFGGIGKVTNDLPGIQDQAYAIAIQPDGKIVLAGRTGNPGDNISGDFALARYNSNGTLDASFGNGGLVSTPIFGSGTDIAYALALQADGKLVAAGSSRNSTSIEQFTLVRYNANGTLDTGFGTGGKVTTNRSTGGVARAIVIRSDGKIIIGGTYNQSSCCKNFVLGYFNSNGSPDTNVGTGGFVETDFSQEEAIQALVLQPDGKVVAIGHSGSGITYFFALARYNGDGSLDTGFGTGGKVLTDISGGTIDQAYAAALQPDGKIVAAGYTSNNFGTASFALARYNGNGSPDNGFGTNGQLTTPFTGGSVVYGVTAQPDGKLVAAGYTTNAASGYDFALARYNSNGSPDTAFGPSANGKVTTDFFGVPTGGGGDRAYAVALQNDGKIVAAGYATSANLVLGDEFALARYEGGGSCGQIALAPAALPDGAINTAYNQSLTASGGAAPYSFSIVSGNLPAGLSLASGGALAGTPAAVGVFNFIVKATDANGCQGTQSYTLAINCLAITINPAAIPGAIIGQPYNQSFTQTGGIGAATFSLTGTLPPGLSFNAATATIFGTPAQTGSFSVTIKATDSNGCQGMRTYSLPVNCPVLNFNPVTLPNGGVGAAYNQTITITGGTAPYGLAVTGGALPAGLTLSAAGLISGTPAQAGTFTFSVTATDANNCSAQFNGYQIVIAPCPAITIAPALLPAGMAGFAYNQALTASGGSGPYAFSIISGTLPVGLGLSSTGVLSGTPLTFGTFNFIVQATGGGGCTGVQSYALAIAPPCNPIIISPATLPGGFVGANYSQTLTASGGTAPYSFTVTGGSLPGGLSLNSASGLLSGLPAAAGTFNLTVTATDATGCTGSRAYTLIVSGNGLVFYPLPRPVRLLDTRGGQGNCDSVSTPIVGGTSLATLARVICEGINIPSTAQAITGNVTVLNNTNQTGYLTIYPTGQSAPVAANMIYGPGAILSNNFTVGLSSDGRFNIFGERTIDVVVDISGYYAPPQPAGLYYHTLPKPIRLLDTRAGEGNCDSVSTPIAAGASLTTLARTTCESLTIPAAAQAIVGNATVINISGEVGYLTIYPNGVAVPLAANMVYFPGQILSNAFNVSLSAGGEFNIFAERTIHTVVDIAGYYSNEAVDANGPGLLFTPLARPLRIMDTRAGEGNCDSVSVPITGNGSIAVPNWLTCESITIPNTARTVLGNVTVINLTPDAGYLTLYPDGVAQPLAANMVYFPGQILSNAFAVGVNSGTGQFRIFAERTLHAIVDVSGYFAP